MTILIPQLFPYKDYRGTVLEEDGGLTIKLVEVSDSISASLDDPGKAQEVFEDLVDDYLKTLTFTRSFE